MDANNRTIEFTLQPATFASAVRVRLRRLTLGWAADVSGPATAIGVGVSARQALTAALQPLGDSAVRVLLADLGLLEPSVAVLALEGLPHPA